MSVPNIGSGGGGFQISPGVTINESDLTTSIGPVSTTEGAIGGVFAWGPIDKLSLVDSENTLVQKYGRPSSLNPETWFTAANFLAYGSALYVSRAGDTSGFSNTISSINLSSNTSISVAGNTTFTTSGIEVGQGVYGNGIPSGTTISAILVGNNSHARATLSNAATLTGAKSLNFFDNSLTFNAVAAETFEPTRLPYLIKNIEDYDTKDDSFGSNVNFIAKYPGELGNSLKVSVCESSAQFTSDVNIATVANSSLFTGTFSIPVGSTVANVVIANTVALSGNSALSAVQLVADKFSVGDIVEVGDTSIGKQYMKVKTIGAATEVQSGGANTGSGYFQLTFDTLFRLSTDFSANSVTRNWEYYNQVDTAPTQSQYVTDFGNTSAYDELHLVVVDEGGKFSGNPGTVLEIFSDMSRATDSKNSSGSTNYYKTIINDQSAYIWSAADRAGSSSTTAALISSTSNSKPLTQRFVGGKDTASEGSLAFGDLARAYDLFSVADEVDISIVMGGMSRGGENGSQLANYLIDNIAEVRKDCIVFVSPERVDVVNSTSPAQNVVTFRNSLRSTSYAVLDSGYKYQYDKYNDVSRWIPLNGDIAGISARSDTTNDPWFSPAGFNRGQVKNIVKLAFNPSKADRDLLYKNGANPVVTLAGQGTILYGDKTLLNKTSAFSAINVRKLFIVLEKSISKAVTGTLFEFNDEFTRLQFRNYVEPYLRDVQGRRGIVDFKVVCDDSNNTDEVVSSSRFVGDIYIRPNRSINYITLNFIAVRGSVEFTEITGS